MPFINPPSSGSGVTVSRDDIGPPQALVTAMERLLDFGPSAPHIDLSNIGGETMSQFWLTLNNLLALNASFNGTGDQQVDLSDNAFNVYALDHTLESIATFFATGCTLDLSGGTNATPTPADAALVVGSGAGGLINGVYARNGDFGGRATYLCAGNGAYARWNVSQWELLTVGNALIYKSTDNVAFPWLVTTWIDDTAFSAPVPTVTQSPHAGVQMIRDAGGTCLIN